MFLTAVLCMAEAIYFESRDQSSLGQMAVGYVVQHRTKDTRYSDDYCEVVHQYMQFEYYWDGKKESINDQQAHMQAMSISMLTILGVIPDPVNGATHFDSLDERPNWAVTAPIQIEDHYFYIGR